MEQKIANKANAAVAIEKAIKALERAVKSSDGGNDISTNQLLQINRCKSMLQSTYEDIMEDLRADGFFGMEE